MMSKKISTKTLAADGIEVHAQIGSFDWEAPPQGSYKPSSKKGYTKCAHSHPPLKIDVEGKDLVYTVYGGACKDPIHDNLDIYVALDYGTAHDTRAYPWHGSRQFIYFPISDMSVPKDAAEFKLMIEWLCDQIVAGKSVHVGCIGGHGRTGMVLAALVRMLGGIKDAITYVRKHYCEKAVETTGQCEWLTKHFDIAPVAGAKAHKAHYVEWPSNPPGRTVSDVVGNAPRLDKRVNDLAKQYSGEVVEITPFTVSGNIWGMPL